MKVYVNSTANLGDFLNGLPVLSGLSKNYGKLDLVIKSGMKKFKGLREFLLYQDIFNSVEFDDDVFMYGDQIIMSSWTREDKGDINRPIETCRYENWLRDNYPGITFNVHDDIELKFPDLEIEIKDNYYVGDRWNVEIGRAHV